MNDDINPRPQKRARLDSSPEMPSSLLSSLSLEPTSPSKPQEPHLKPLPQAILLVSLPALLAHPPTHKFYIPSICLSLSALRKCVTIPALSPEIECRAWTGLAEIGMRVIAGGLHENEEFPWAQGIESEVDKALSKASVVSQKHPSLRAYKHHIALLQVQLSHWQHKIKYARTQIRNLLSSFQHTDPPHTVYAAYLAAISIFTTPKPAPVPPAFSSQASHAAKYQTTPPSPAYSQNPQDVHAALASVSNMETLSLSQKHIRVTLLSHVLRLRILVATSMWGEVAETLQRVEAALGLSYEPATTPKPRRPDDPLSTGQPRRQPDAPPAEEFIFFDDPFEAAMAVHALMMSVVYFTHIGSAADASPRLSHLHALLDSGVLDKFAEGTVEVKLSAGPPLVLQITHPRILFLLAFLVSSVAKRDPVGRKPKRKVFAVEGLASWEKELDIELQLSPWANLGDIEEVEQRLARIKADLLCELIAVSIMRSEWDVAEQNLAQLIAHTRTYNIFPYFAARISLHHAHLAHAIGQTSRAMECYRVAAALAEDGSFVQTTAQASGIVLRVGVRAQSVRLGKRKESVDVEEVSATEAMQVTKACRNLGGTLGAVGQVIEALLSNEILKTK
ncbi:uncharacterized protein PHACADRAFT_204728 [Phanerochaete carnosa HHB-10118-sp]|uniref:Anaphase-promoting complex subunit 5 n=1 Tax=Phanerochaete carnosa (strain HHB-10118-sp) TaxID=650164 RepID=K5WC72_PHACS|nr:uncharacterized protein PHACADRAFT_204728 [Phanerochaete carnosa HHB-10118-sp]EKM61558.1 hypothetical protein PHACADRAFT_204728 [Phanerochaete carnosa HHB-10118-sp]